MKKVCVVTGTRAEYGLLKPVISKIDMDSELELYLVVTGAHLSPEFGLTYQEIEQDGFCIHKKIEMLLSADTPSSIVKSMGVEMLGFADAYSESKPDLVILLGDRYEILVAATAAMIHRIPIAHIHGGELTEGVIDEAIRHSITKMSLLHFAATEEYRKRIIQLGEHPDRVFNVGSLGIENLKKLKLLSKDNLEKQINFRIDNNTIIVTFHPATLENKCAKSQFENILQALENYNNLRVIFTKANADADGRIINQLIDNFVIKHKERMIAYTSMGQLRYLSTLKYCKAVIGNSSSAIIEVPSFGIPSLDIGDRQKGRVRAKSVIHCEASQSEIEDAMNYILSDECIINTGQVCNPYDKEHTSDKIVEVIKKVLVNEVNIKKQFYDLKV